jgi:hypothetical protein
MCTECRFHDPPNDDLVLLPDQPAAEESVNLNVNLRYLCLVYEDEEKIDALAERESEFIAAENFEYLGELERSGHSIAAARLQPAETATTIRVRDGSVFISNGTAAGARERLSAFYLIDARDLNDAIRIAAKMPAARLGSIEVRPLEECDSG